MDSLFVSILSSPLSTAIFALTSVFMLLYFKFSIVPQLEDKDKLDDELTELKAQYTELSDKYTEVLAGAAASIDKVANFLDAGFEEKLESIVEHIRSTDQSETLQGLVKLIEVQTESLAAVNDLMNKIKSEADKTGKDLSEILNTVNNISKDCTDLIRRHDLVMSALLQKLTGESHNVQVRGLK